VKPHFRQPPQDMVQTHSPAAITAVAVWLALASVSAQPSAPRTADGRPDLQGYWDNAIATPLQRPKPLADKELLPRGELLDRQHAERRAARRSD
jgi:hypothetical protein